MKNITSKNPLVNNLKELLEAHRPLFKQQRTYERVVALLLAKLLSFGRQTVTQLLLALGLSNADWSSWYRLFSQERIPIEGAQKQLFVESLKHAPEDKPYVVAVDGTQVWRTGKKIEGTGWLRNVRTPRFKVGIHQAQRWAHGAWMIPAEEGYSRAVPLKWEPAFTAKSRRVITPACKEWEAAVNFGEWVKQGLAEAGRQKQPVLMLGDGSYDNLNMWRELPAGIFLLARSAKNRKLYYPMTEKEKADSRRSYGQRAPTPQQMWQQRSGWKRMHLFIRGKQRQFSYRIEGPFFRYGAPDIPLFAITVRGRRPTEKHHKYRKPVPYLVQATTNEQGEWVLPFPAETLLFWAWQRWEIEVAHRELKSNFGLGHQQSWHPAAAILSVQWVAWLYALLLLAAYRSWGLTGGPPVPTRWWKGSGRWSFNTMWRAYRAAFWGKPHLPPLWPGFASNWHLFSPDSDLISHSTYFSTRL